MPDFPLVPIRRNSEADVSALSQSLRSIATTSKRQRQTADAYFALMTDLDFQKAAERLRAAWQNCKDHRERFAAKYIVDHFRPAVFAVCCLRRLGQQNEEWETIRQSGLNQFCREEVMFFSLDGRATYEWEMELQQAVANLAAKKDVESIRNFAEKYPAPNTGRLLEELWPPLAPSLIQHSLRLAETTIREGWDGELKALRDGIRLAYSDSGAACIDLIRLYLPVIQRGVWKCLATERNLRSAIESISALSEDLSAFRLIGERDSIDSDLVSWASEFFLNRLRLQISCRQRIVAGDEAARSELVGVFGADAETAIDDPAADLPAPLLDLPLALEELQRAYRHLRRGGDFRSMAASLTTQLLAGSSLYGRGLDGTWLSAAALLYTYYRSTIVTHYAEQLAGGGDHETTFRLCEAFLVSTGSFRTESLTAFNSCLPSAYTEVATLLKDAWVKAKSLASRPKDATTEVNRFKENEALIRSEIERLRGTLDDEELERLEEHLRNQYYQSGHHQGHNR